MAKNEGIEELPWSLDEIFGVLKLSSEARERATMVRGFLDDSIRMRPAFPRPDKSEVVATQVYSKYVTKKEKRLFLVRCGIEEYYYTLPDDMVVQMQEFHKKMLRVRAYMHADTQEELENLLPYDGCDEPEEPLMPPGEEPAESQQGEQKAVKWYEEPGYKMTSDEALLFADRVEEPVQ